MGISGDTIVVGARREASSATTITNGTGSSSDTSASSAGAVYVYTRSGSSWTQQAYIKAVNAESLDYFGSSVAIDGDTIAVSAYGEDSNTTTIINGTTAAANGGGTVGAIYVYRRNGTNWSQEAYLKTPNADSSDELGRYGIEISNDTIIAGAHDEDGGATTITNSETLGVDNSKSRSGAAYIFRRTGTTWKHEAYLKASNSDIDDYFGWDVSIDGDIAVVGAPYESSNATGVSTTASSDNSIFQPGAAYVYRRVADVWSQVAYLKAFNTDANDEFGISVAISGDIVVVGAHQESSIQKYVNNSATGSSDNSAETGAAYVYELIDGVWTGKAYLKASSNSDGFGNQVAINGNDILIGADYEPSNSSTLINGSHGSNDTSLTRAGAAYVYTKIQKPVAQTAYIKASNVHANAVFGSVVDIDGDTAVVGSYADYSNSTTIVNGTTASTNTSAPYTGAAFVYLRTASNWAQQAYIKAGNAGASDNFGKSVSISGDTIAIGATAESSDQTTITNGTGSATNDLKSSSGAVYVYKRTGTSWTQEAYIKASNADFIDKFGTVVSIYRDTLAVGTFFESSNQTTITTTASSNNSNSLSGAVYIFKRTGTSWALEAYIKPSNNRTNLYFGYSIDIYDETLVVGAIGDASNQTSITNGTTASSDTSAVISGAVFVYTRSGTTWTQEAYIKASNNRAGNAFGVSVAIDFNTLAVGSQLEDSNSTTIINGTTASSDTSTADSGAVYVYKRSGTIWAQEAYIKPSNNFLGSYFGYSVGLWKNKLVVGAQYERSSQTTINNDGTSSTTDGGGEFGAAFLFERTGTNWSQKSYIKSSNLEVSDGFGTSVAISNDTILVGAPNEDANVNTITNGSSASADNTISGSGAVFVYEH